MLPVTEILHLRCFIEAADAGSITGAADRLSTGQAAVSNSLRRLEANLGVELFQRTRRGLQLTPQGSALLAHAREIVSSAQSVRAELKQFSRSVAGTLRIGFPPIVAKSLAPRLMEIVLQHHPGVMVSFLEAYSWDVQDWLEAGKIDIGLFYGGPGIELPFVRSVATEELFLVGRERVETGADGCITVEQIFELPLALPSPPHGHRLQMEKLAARSRRSLNVVFEIDSLGALLGIVRMGQGYGLLPKSALPPDLKAHGLHVMPFRERDLCRVLMMGTPVRRPLSLVAKTFLPIVEELCRTQSLS